MVFMFYGIKCSAFFMFQCVAAVSFSSSQAFIIAPILVLFIDLFCGLLISIPQFPIWLQWGPNICFSRWVTNRLMLNELKHNTDIDNAQSQLEDLSYDTVTKEICAVILVAFVVGQCICFFLFLKFINYEKR